MPEHTETHAVSMLFPVSMQTIATEDIPTINGRDLYDFLEVKRDYTNWIKGALEGAQRIENKDYIVYAENGVNPKGGRPRTEYHLTLECCEHIGMMTNTAKGVVIREEFIRIKKLCNEISHNVFWRLRDTKRRGPKGEFETKFQGTLASMLNALNEKTRIGIAKLPGDLGSPRVAGIVPAKIREMYLGVLGEAVYGEARDRTEKEGAAATHQMIGDMSLDMMRGMMFGLAVAARSEGEYTDLLAVALGNKQLSMPFRWRNGEAIKGQSK